MDNWTPVHQASSKNESTDRALLAEEHETTRPAVEVEDVPGIAGDKRNVDRQAEPDKPASPRVSNREEDVLRRAALGHRQKDIAAALGLAVKTIEVHKANAMRKLGLRHRADLVRYAAARGWLTET